MFYPGNRTLKKNNNTPVPLPHFLATAPELCNSRQLANGWTSYPIMHKNRARALVSAQVARCILLTNNPDPAAIFDTTICLLLNTSSPLAYARR
eukprot:12119796-Ditylum_brightwellii.AAC.1